MSQHHFGLTASPHFLSRPVFIFIFSRYLFKSSSCQVQSNSSPVQVMLSQVNVGPAQVVLSPCHNKVYIQKNPPKAPAGSLIKAPAGSLIKTPAGSLIKHQPVQLPCFVPKHRTHLLPSRFQGVSSQPNEAPSLLPSHVFKEASTDGFSEGIIQASIS